MINPLVSRLRQRSMARRIVVGALSLSIASFASLAVATTPSSTDLIDILASMPSSATGTALKRPSWTLTQGSDGYFYGTAMQGGAYNGGGVFQISPGGDYTDLYDFQSPLGTLPWGGLLEIGKGIFYGTLAQGSNAYQGGTLYSFVMFGPTSRAMVNQLYAFQAVPDSLVNADGGVPIGNLIRAPNGSYFGVTAIAGPNSGGTIYSFSPTGTFSVVQSFYAPGTPGALANGSRPNGTLTVGADGNLYGTTREGGANDQGIIFRLTPAGVFTTVYSFPAYLGSLACGASQDPGSGTLTVGPDGNLYGTHCRGGANGQGFVFRYVVAQNQVTTVYDFLPATPNAVSGVQTMGANGALVFGADGNFYGTLGSGGPSGNGAVFRIRPDGSNFQEVYDFGVSDTLDGQTPNPLIVGADNNFYGTTAQGGANNTGAIFRVNHRPQADVVLTNPDTGVLDVRLATQFGIAQIQENVAKGYYPVAVADFDGDGIPDILWTSSNNDLYMWLGGKGSSTGFQAKYIGTYPAGWTVTGAGDIDGDGKADLYWINTSTHQFAYWLMNGPTRIASYTTNYTPGYYPIATGDFDGDGKLDVLWSSAQNDLYIWFSQATTQATSQAFNSAYAGTFPAGWKVSATGDLNGDGTSDIVWISSDGTKWGYWLMKGTQRLAENTQTVPPSVIGNSVVAVGDYDGDGVADLVWGNGLTIWTGVNGCSNGDACTFTPYTGALAPANGKTVFQAVRSINR